MKRRLAMLLSIPIMLAIPAPTSAVTYDTTYNGHGYKIYNDGMTWQQAKKYCENQGGHLVTINSSQEQAVIVNLLRSKGNKNSYWLGGYKNNNAWKWVTGEAFSYTKWATWQPDGDGAVLMMYRNKNPYGNNSMGDWNDISFTGDCKNEPFFGANNFGFICEWESSSPDSYEFDYNGHHYKIYDNGTTWQQAKSFCESQPSRNGLKAHLLTINSADEQNIIQSKLNSMGKKNSYWLGGYKNGNNWTWVTGESFSYKNWGQWQPDGDGAALMMYRSTGNGWPLGAWNDIPAGGGTGPFFGTSNFGFVCEWGVESAINNINHNPQGSNITVESTSPNSLHVRGTAYDQDNMNGSVRINEKTNPKVARECKEFASYIFGQLYLGGKGYNNGGYIGGSKTNYDIYNQSRVGCRGIKTPRMTLNGVKELFQNAQPGDFIQMQRAYKNKKGNYGPHSAILLEKNSTGVKFFEANAPDENGNYLYNKINVTFYTYEKLVEKNQAMSIYYAK